MLSNQTFYNKTTEKAIVAFGNLFANINIQRFNGDGSVQQVIKVPISYAPKEKFLARMQQQPNIDTNLEELTLPRLAFEITNIQRNPSRQMNAMQRQRSTNGASSFNPVPYDLTISLYAVAKTQTDAWQMFEQIIPTFTPNYILTMKAVPALGLTDDLPINLDGVTLDDNYDQKFEERRLVIFTFSFTLQLNYYGYIDTNSGGKVIKQTEVSFYGDSDVTTAPFLEEVKSVVNPFTANATDNYTIITTIEGFNGSNQ